jgi:hypothetical protein
LGVALLTQDAHYDFVPNLQVINLTLGDSHLQDGLLGVVNKE